MIAFMLEYGALCSFAHVIAVHTVFDLVFSSVSVPSPVPPPPFCFLFALLRVFQRLSLASRALFLAVHRSCECLLRFFFGHTDPEPEVAKRFRRMLPPELASVPGKNFLKQWG